MLYMRKNVGGAWHIISLSIEEAKSVQDKVMKMSLTKVQEIQALAREKGIENISDTLVAVILDKVAPSFDSIANDYAESKLRKENQTPQ